MQTKPKTIDPDFTAILSIIKPRLHTSDYEAVATALAKVFGERDGYETANGEVVRSASKRLAVRGLSKIVVLVIGLVIGYLSGAAL